RFAAGKDAGGNRSGALSESGELTPGRLSRQSGRQKFVGASKRPAAVAGLKRSVGHKMSARV
ncbi:MAG: hypothetical protein ACK48X_03160, partial [Planctomycetota bacterium]